MALPGTYSATLFKREGATVTQLAEPVQFTLESIYEGALEGASAEEITTYGNALTKAQKRAMSSTTVLKQVKDTMALLRVAIDRTPSNVTQFEAQFASIQSEINDINKAFTGLESRNRKGIKPANIMSRLRYARSALNSSYGPTQQHKDQLGYAEDELSQVIARIKTLHETTLPALQQAVVNEGGPWTAGIPVIAN